MTDLGGSRRLPSPGSTNLVTVSATGFVTGLVARSTRRRSRRIRV